ncbi:hypothetical protein GCM10022255_091630 [Dactylosporangium darangshiense]|uniref:Uncharacterized protein n=1 Tax=Dactylosporangium darangshiense TaxID=579108 RepID=A0ABP8DPS2_9ACTN
MQAREGPARQLGDRDVAAPGQHARLLLCHECDSALVPSTVGDILQRNANIKAGGRGTSSG